MQEQQRSGKKPKSYALNEKIKAAIKDMQDNKAGGRIRLEYIRQMLKTDFKLDYANPSRNGVGALPFYYNMHLNLCSNQI